MTLLDSKKDNSLQDLTNNKQNKVDFFTNMLWKLKVKYFNYHALGMSSSPT